MSRRTSAIVNRLNISYFWSFKKFSYDYTSFFKLLNSFSVIRGLLTLNSLDLVYYYFNKISVNSVSFTAIVYPFKEYLSTTSDQSNITINFYFMLSYMVDLVQSYLIDIFYILNFILSNSMVFFKQFIFNINEFFLFVYFYKYSKLLLLRLSLLLSSLISNYTIRDGSSNLNAQNIITVAKRRVLLGVELSLKNVEVYLKDFLARFFTKNIEVNVVNIFSVVGLQNYKIKLDFLNLWYLKNLNYFWNFINIFYMGLLFNNLDLITEVIARGLSRKQKTHKKYIFSIISILGNLYRQRILPIRGLRLVVSGKIDTKVRKKYICYTRGRLGLQTLKAKLLYSLVHHDTKFGVISIRFWLTKF